MNTYSVLAIAVGLAIMAAGLLWMAIQSVYIGERIRGALMFSAWAWLQAGSAMTGYHLLRTMGVLI